MDILCRGSPATAVGVFFALLAGMMGALASASAKLALGTGHLREVCISTATVWQTEATALCESLHKVLLLGCIGLVFACNAVMWTFFVKALRFSSSSAAATVTSTASNFLFSAFLGKILLGEVCNLLWWVGISVTLLGLLLLHTGPPQTDQMDSEKKEK